MLLKYKHHLFPEDTSVAVADFVAANVNRDNRFFIIYEIPHTPLNHYRTDEAYFNAGYWRSDDSVINVRSLKSHCNPREIVAYALNHIVAIFPNSMKRQNKKAAGVLRTDFRDWVEHIPYTEARQGLLRWVANNHDVTYFDRYTTTVREIIHVDAAQKQNIPAPRYTGNSR